MNWREAGGGEGKGQGLGDEWSSGDIVEEDGRDLEEQGQFRGARC